MPLLQRLFDGLRCLATGPTRGLRAMRNNLDVVILTLFFFSAAILNLGIFYYFGRLIRENIFLIGRDIAAAAANVPEVAVPPIQGIPGGRPGFVRHVVNTVMARIEQEDAHARAWERAIAEQAFLVFNRDPFRPDAQLGGYDTDEEADE